MAPIHHWITWMFIILLYILIYRFHSFAFSFLYLRRFGFHSTYECRSIFLATFVCSSESEWSYCHLNGMKRFAHWMRKSDVLIWFLSKCRKVSLELIRRKTKNEKFVWAVKEVLVRNRHCEHTRQMLLNSWIIILCLDSLVRASPISPMRPVDLAIIHKQSFKSLYKTLARTKRRVVHGGEMQLPH